MKKIIKLNEKDLSRIVKRVLTEGTLEDFRANLKGSKFPGERSMKYCAKTLGLKKDFQEFLSRCSVWVVSPLGGMFGASAMKCAAEIVGFTDDMLKIAGCTTDCATTGKYKNKTCS